VQRSSHPQGFSAWLGCDGLSRVVGLGSPRPHPHRDRAHPGDICNGGLGSPRPLLRRHWAHPGHIQGSPSHIYAGTRLTPAASAPGLGCRLRTSGERHGQVRLPRSRSRTPAMPPSLFRTSIQTQTRTRPRVHFPGRAARPACRCPLGGSGSATPQSKPAWFPARRRAQAQAVTDSESIPHHVCVLGTIA
jgi:hypothetical protein